MPRYHFEKVMKTKSITMYVAVCGLIRELRPFVHRPAVSFVAVLKVPNEEDLETYQMAAEYLLQVPADKTTDDFRGGESRVSVETFSDFADAINIRRAQSLRYNRRAVVLHSGTGEIPGQVLLGADLVSEIKPPTPGHYMAAAMTTGLFGMTEQQAAFLCGCTFYNVRLAFRSRRPLANGLRRLKTLAEEARADEEKEKKTAVVPVGRRLEYAVGYGEARDWGLRVAEDLKAWSARLIDWRDVDRGALLVGPPGSGKTTYAAMQANTCGAKLVVASAAKWQAAGTGHLGDMLKAMRESFDEATQGAPSILFIDEFDSIGNRADRDSHNADYDRKVTNAMLELLDGAIGHEGVVVVGATNYPGRIDAGLLRPGRLETHLVIPPLDASARLSVLRGHIDIRDLAFADGGFEEATNGWSGAQIEELARDARRVARTERRTVTAADVAGLLPARIPVPAAMLDRLAIHELGHAIVGVLLGAELVSVEISDARYEGAAGAFGMATFVTPAFRARTRSDYLDDMACYLAGMAAEQLVFGEHSDGAAGHELSDLAKATNVATLIEVHWAMGGVMVSEFGDDYRRLEMLRADPRRFARIDALMQEQMERARGLLATRMEVLMELKAKLVERKRLEGKEVLKLMGRSTDVGFC